MLTPTSWLLSLLVYPLFIPYWYHLQLSFWPGVKVISSVWMIRPACYCFNLAPHICSAICDLSVYSLCSNSHKLELFCLKIAYWSTPHVLNNYHIAVSLILVAACTQIPCLLLSRTKSLLKRQQNLHTCVSLQTSIHHVKLSHFTAKSHIETKNLTKLDGIQWSTFFKIIIWIQGKSSSIKFSSLSHCCRKFTKCVRNKFITQWGQNSSRLIALNPRLVLHWRGAR